MIKAPSLVAEFSLIYSGDPSLSLPDGEEERTRVLKLARETGDWSPLIGGGGEPTLFHFKQISRSELGWLLGEFQHSSDLGRPLHGVEFQDLVVRLAIRGVDNFGKHKVERKRHRGEIHLARPDIIEAIHTEGGEHGSAIIGEFADFIVERAQGGIRPL